MFLQTRRPLARLGAALLAWLVVLACGGDDDGTTGGDGPLFCETGVVSSQLAPCSDACRCREGICTAVGDAHFCLPDEAPDDEPDSGDEADASDSGDGGDEPDPGDIADVPDSGDADDGPDSGDADAAPDTADVADMADSGDTADAPDIGDPAECIGRICEFDTDCTGELWCLPGAGETPGRCVMDCASGDDCSGADCNSGPERNHCAFLIPADDREVCPGTGRCLDDGQCAGLGSCFAPGQPLPCGACLNPSPCVSDALCADERGRLEAICEPGGIESCLCNPSTPICLLGCLDDSGCGPGESCDVTDYRCDPSDCLSSDDCPENFDCVEQACARLACGGSNDCPEGFCVNGSCFASSGQCLTPPP